MERAEPQGDVRCDSSSSRVLSTTASFRSATSYASFRSCNSFKSIDGLSRASFKSVASRGTSYYSAASRFLGRSVSDGAPVSEGLEGVDNLSFFSFEGGEEILSSLQSEGQARVAASHKQSSAPISTNTDMSTGTEKDPGVSKAGHRFYLGCLLLLLTAILHTTTSTITLLLSPELDPWLLLLSRALLQLAVSLILLPIVRINPLGLPGYRWRIYLIGLISAILVLSLYLTLTRLPAAESGALLGLAPIFTVILSVLMAREHTGLLRILTCALFLAGLLLQTRPSIIFSDMEGHRQALTQYNILGVPVTFLPAPSPLPMDELGLVAAIFAAVFSALLLILSSQCRGKASVHTVLILFWTSLGLTLVSIIGLFTQTTEKPIMLLQALLEKEWLLIGLVAVLGSLATACLMLSLTWVTPGRASLLVSSWLLLSYALQLVLEVGEAVPNWLDLVGAACFLLSLLCAGLEGVMVDTQRWRWL